VTSTVTLLRISPYPPVQLHQGKLSLLHGTTTLDLLCLQRSTSWKYFDAPPCNTFPTIVTVPNSDGRGWLAVNELLLQSLGEKLREVDYQALLQAVQAS